MANQSFLSRLKRAGFIDNMTLRTLGALPLLASRGAHPSILIPLHAISRPHVTFLTDRRGNKTYRQFRDRICQIANAIRQRGGDSHDGVMIMVPNSIAFLESLYACTTGGFTSVFVPNRSTPEEISYLAENSQAKWLITDAQYIDRFEQADVRGVPTQNRFVVHNDASTTYQDLDEVISSASTTLPPLTSSKTVHNISYTSGTTGRPKGAKRNLGKVGLPKVLKFLELVPFRGSDVHLACCPLYHSAPMGTIQSHLALGARVVIQERFEAIDWLRMIDQHKVTTTCVVPTMIHDLLQVSDDKLKNFDTSSLRIMMTTGAPLTQDQRDRVWNRFGDVLYDMYGSTEWGWLSVATPPDHRERPGTVGKTVPGIEIRILDDEGKPVAVGETGELFARTELQIDEYHQNTEATAAAMNEGFMSVGDLVRQDQDGYLFIIDRKGDMVISGGVNVYPPEVEEVLKDLPHIDDAAVIGVPDERLGQKLVAFVVFRPGSDQASESIIDSCRRRLEGPKIPREYRSLEAIPRNAMGKILKDQLRSAY